MTNRYCLFGPSYRNRASAPGCKRRRSPRSIRQTSCPGLSESGAPGAFGWFATELPGYLRVEQRLNEARRYLNIGVGIGRASLKHDEPHLRVLRKAFGKDRRCRASPDNDVVEILHDGVLIYIQKGVFGVVPPTPGD